GNSMGGVISVTTQAPEGTSAYASAQAMVMPFREYGFDETFRGYSVEGGISWKQADGPWSIRASARHFENVGQSMSHLSHLAWTAAIWNNYDERSNTYGWLTIFSTIGFLTIMAFPPLMVHLFGTKQADSVSSMGWLIIVALPLTMLFALSSVGEAPPADKRHERPRLQDYLRLAKRPSVLRLMVVDMLWGIGPTVAGTLFFAFFDALKLIPREISGFILLMYFVAGLARWWWRASFMRFCRAACCCCRPARHGLPRSPCLSLAFRAVRDRS
ncbi:MAG: MFS transporter, partial [Alphaproteobacteria bacterium]|nr:MFS transporter [Alphaproteobacteria bacterium]